MHSTPVLQTNTSKIMANHKDDADDPQTDLQVYCIKIFGQLKFVRVNTEWLHKNPVNLEWNWLWCYIWEIILIIVGIPPVNKFTATTIFVASFNFFFVFVPSVHIPVCQFR